MEHVAVVMVSAVLTITIAILNWKRAYTEMIRSRIQYLLSMNLINYQ